MRGIFGDALRSFDVLLDQQEVLISDVAVIGSGLGGALALAVAARRASVHAVAANTPLALGNPESFKPGLGYPLAELGDYLRMFPDRSDAVKQSTEDLDLLKLASHITAQVLLSIGTNDTSSCPLSFGKNLSEMIPDCDLRIYRGASEGGGHEHAQVQLNWLLDKLGLG
jgi:cephalosporin-C deacetylase-like acetyl esterase